MRQGRPCDSDHASPAHHRVTFYARSQRALASARSLRLPQGSLAEVAALTLPTMCATGVRRLRSHILRWSWGLKVRRQLGPCCAPHLRSFRTQSGHLQGQPAAFFDREEISVSFGAPCRSRACCIVYRDARSGREVTVHADLSAESGSGIRRRLQSWKSVRGSGHAELGVRVGFGSYTRPKTNRSPPITVTSPQ
jgi:hypothetical protein